MQLRSARRRREGKAFDGELELDGVTTIDGFGLERGRGNVEKMKEM
jgi:hypothetical protein